MVLVEAGAFSEAFEAGSDQLHRAFSHPVARRVAGRRSMDLDGLVGEEGEDAGAVGEREGRR